MTDTPADLSPAEIMSRFPVGKMMELSADVRQKIVFLTEIVKATDHINRVIAENFKEGQDVTNADIYKVVEKALNDNPLKSMLSITMGNGWANPASMLAAKSNIHLLKSLIWTLIYADIIKTYHITRKTWLSIKFCILEQPVAGGILVQGYEFRPEDLNPDAKKQSNKCPDFPPFDILDEP